MYLFATFEQWVNWVLYVLMIAIRLWAIIDCASRKGPAFPAAGKLTKPAWLAITIGSGILGGFFFTGLGIIPLATLVASLVYLADVRPAVREVSGGSGSRW